MVFTAARFFPAARFFRDGAAGCRTTLRTSEFRHGGICIKVRWLGCNLKSWQIQQFNGEPHGRRGKVVLVLLGERPFDLQLREDSDGKTKVAAYHWLVQ